MSKNQNDQITLSNQVISVVHYATHEGFMTMASHRFEGVANDAVVELLISINENISPHYFYTISTEGKTYVDVFEGPTNSSAGTAIVKSNKNRFFDPCSDCTITHGPTITDDGIQILNNGVMAGTGPKPGGGKGGLDEEVNLKNSTDYLFRLTNKSGGAIDIALLLEWYSVPIDIQITG